MAAKKQTIERQMAVQFKPSDTGKSLVYNIPEEVLKKEPFNPRFYIRDKNREELIKYFEKGIRDSFEYRWLIDMFKKTLNVKECVFFKGYSIDNGMKLEFHHHPFTLYDYTEAVVNKQLEEHDDDDHGNYVLENEVKREVTMIHYRLMVGLVPLDPTSHGQVHDGLLDIPPQLIIGDYDRFVESYSKWISEEAKNKYSMYCNAHPVDQDLVYPANYVYKPMTIIASNKTLITTEKVDQLLLADKLDKVNNEDIAKLLAGK